MDYRDSISQRKPVSILEGDEFCVNKILARDSSVGRSSRIYYRSTNEGVGVPFKWEMQPGTPKTPPTEEMIPPPTPPPAIQSLGIPHPNLDHHTKESRRWRFWFWKRSKKRQEKHKALTLRGNYKRSVTTTTTTTNGGDHGVSSDHEFEGFHEFGDSDGEFFTTSVHDSRSSSSSSSSSNGIHLGTEPRLRIRGVPLFCSPWQH